MRRWLAFTALAAMPWVAVAQAKVSETAAVENNPSAARVIWLDKQTNTRLPLTLNVGAAQTLGTLALRLERCVMDVQGVPNTDAAWLVVSEPGRGADWFAGWMFNTMPEVATLDHPRYDVQVVGCGTQSRKKAGPVARSGKIEAGMDMESVEAAGDAYVVPGMEGAESAVSASAPEPTALPETETPPATPILQTEPEPAAAEPTPVEAPAARPSAPAAQDELHQMMDGVY